MNQRVYLIRTCIYLYLIVCSAFSLGQTEIPQQVLDLKQAAKDSIEGKNISQAISYYEQIEQSFPDTAFAMDAKVQIICLEIRAGQDDEAQADIAILETQYASQENYLNAIQTIGNQYRKSRKRDDALALYLKTLEQFSGKTGALALKQDVVEMYLEKKNKTAANIVLENLMSQHSDAPEYRRVIMDIANKYRSEARDYAKGRALYTHLLEQFGQEPDAWRYQNAITKTCLEQEKPDSADKELDLLFTQYSHPDMAAQVVDLGWIYLKKYGMTDKSIEICNRLFEQFPNTSQAARIQGLLVVSHLYNGNYEQAGKETDVLLSKYSEYPDFIATIGTLSDSFQEDKLYARVIQLQRVLLDKASGPKQVIPITADIASAMIMKGDFAEVQTVTDNLQMDFAGRGELGGALNVIAHAWRSKKQYDKALALYSTVEQIRPGTKDQAEAQMGTAVVYLNLGQDDKVRELVDTMFLRFESHPKDYGYHLFKIGNEYYSRAFVDDRHGRLTDKAPTMLSKAISIWENPAWLDSFPQKSKAVYYTGLAYHYLNQYEPAIKAYKKLIQNWPEYERTGNSLRLMGMCYASMAKKGIGDPNLTMGLTSELAMAEAEKAWQTVVKEYPKCILSYDAAMRLAEINERRGQWLDAAGEYKFVLSRCGSDPRRAQMTFKLGNMYDQAGQMDLARDTYLEYVQIAPAQDKYMPDATAALLRIERNEQ